MRPLTEEETKIFFEKLAKYIGKNILYLIDRTEPTYCFRLHRDRVYYLTEEMMRKSTNISRDCLISLGVCFGKFTKSLKFKLQITALEIIAQYAQNKVWLKSSGEMSFLYGNHIVKAHVGRVTDDVPEHEGVVVYSMSDVPLGFGVTSRSGSDFKKLEPTAIVVFHQADAGEYLREEEAMF